MKQRGDRTRQERTCVQCGRAAEKGSFFRIAGRPETGWEPDPEGRKPGRGIYLCRAADCVEGFAKRVRTPKGAGRWKMGVNGPALADKVAAWWAAEASK